MLNKGHVNFITSSIDYLLDFSSDEEQLLQEMKLLVEALEKKVAPIHDFYHLQQFFLEPQKNLPGLEKFNQEKENTIATVADVQYKILDIILTTLQPLLSELEFEKLQDKIKQVSNTIITERNKMTMFTTQHSQSPQASPIQFSPPNSIFSATLAIDNHTGHIIWDIHIGQPFPAYYRTNFMRATNQNTASILMGHLQKQAVMHASKCTGEYVVLELLERGIINFLVYAKYFLTKEPVHLLLTNKIYLDLILKHEITLAELLNFNFSEEQLETLSHPVTTILLEKKIFHHANLSAIAEINLKLYQAYLNEILSGKIKTTQLNFIEDKQAPILLLPVIQHLIKQDKISFNQALVLPLSSRPILKNALYAEYFLKNGIDVLAFSQLQDQDFIFLNNPEIASLIKDGFFKLTTVNQFSDMLKAMLNKKNITRILQAHVLTLPQLANLPFKTLEILAENDHLTEQLIAGQIQVSELPNMNFTTIYSNVFAKKLVALCDLSADEQLDYSLQLEKEIYPIINGGKLEANFFQSLCNCVIDNLSIKLNAELGINSLSQHSFTEFKKLLAILCQSSISPQDKYQYLINYLNLEFNPALKAQREYLTHHSTITKAYHLFTQFMKKDWPPENFSSTYQLHRSLNNIATLLAYLPCGQLAPLKQQQMLMKD